MHSPAESDGDYSSAVLGDLEKHGHGKIKMWTRWVAPSAIVAGQCKVRRTEVGCSYENGWATRIAPFGIICTFDLKASAATETIIEECCAQGCCVHSITLAVKITISTSTTCAQNSGYKQVIN